MKRVPLAIMLLLLLLSGQGHAQEDWRPLRALPVQKVDEQEKVGIPIALGVILILGSCLVLLARRVGWKNFKKGNDKAEDNLFSVADEDNDFDIILKAAQQGNFPAQAKLGTMYATGQGVAQDYTEAVKWFRKAAEQGESISQNNLGAMYATGQGVPQNHEEAVNWFRKAADQGQAEGQLFLGWMYCNGQGVLQDYVQAHMWFNLAASQGSKDAIKKRDLLTESMTPAQLAQAQDMARNWRPTKL